MTPYYNKPTPRGLALHFSAAAQSGLPIIPFRASGLSALLSGGGDLTAGARRLIAGGSDPLLPHLVDRMGEARSADVAVAFVLPTGLTRMRDHFQDLLHRGGPRRLWIRRPHSSARRAPPHARVVSRQRLVLRLDYSAASQIRRGSKLWDANIVTITTVANAVAPGCASMRAMLPRFTSATRIEIRNFCID